ncbi:BLUF domain-containing protein [Aestuariibacter sp. AA17]|uniref:BLUF domain-containing protein n=1 Tax=Fluctibacter corallii TaxID=2984329 RepID=A0ABT3A8N9_9ALTE|nr:BLUF domain-containing protein [Aestuariibacter sp. AA17]MCV2885019.1 BLUF domain-containing protein [Aestuariibacter sp. AA17]
MSNPLRQLVYVSHETSDNDESSLLQLLQTCRDRNASLQITGFLIYCDGNFFQIIEGPADNLPVVWNAIQKDARHSGVTLLLERPIEHRAFASWEMAFEHYQSEVAITEQGYNRFLSRQTGDDIRWLSLQQQDSDIARMITQFKQNCLGSMDLDI